MRGGRRIMKLLAERAGGRPMKMALAPGLAKLQKNDKRPKAESATPYDSLLPLLPLTSHGTRREVSQKFSPKGGGTRGHGRRRAGLKQCRLLFPKVFLFSFASLPQRQRQRRPQLGKETLEPGSFAIASDISFVLLSFIIILPLSLLTHFFFAFFFAFCCCCCSFTLLLQLGQAKLAVKMY